VDLIEGKSYLLGIDPGLATGICLIDITNMDDPESVDDAEWTIEEFHDNIEGLMESGQISVVMENYYITPETGKLSPQPWSLHLIGVVLFLAHKYGVKVVLQKPSQKPFATTERLQSVGFWSKGTEGHAIDAYRHAMIWIVDRNRKWTRKLLV
jgi:hypothetical protein